MAACKNSANSNGGFSRTRRGVFILNTYRSTPYLERRADGAPPPVLPETGCTSSGHLGGRRGHCQVFASGQAFLLYRRGQFSNFCYVGLIFFYLAVHFGHWQQLYTVAKLSEGNQSSLEPCSSSHNLIRPFSVMGGHVVCASTRKHALILIKRKSISKKYKCEKWKFSFFEFWHKSFWVWGPKSVYIR